MKHPVTVTSNMNKFIFRFICFGCCVHTSLGDILPSYPNVSHYACDSKCISKYSESLDSQMIDCESDTSRKPDCLGKQLGEQLPAEACDFARAINASAEDLNKLLHNGRFAAYKWNIIRESLTKGLLCFKYISEKEMGTVTNIEVIADTESSKIQCQYNFEVMQNASYSEQVPYYTVTDGIETRWLWGWLFHSENVHIFVSCLTEDGQLTTEPFGSVVVYIRESYEKEGNEALKTLDYLESVQFDNTIVNCI